jgi:hypothetical protein
MPGGIAPPAGSGERERIADRHVRHRHPVQPPAQPLREVAHPVLLAAGVADRRRASGAGIVIAALGVTGVLAHAERTAPLGPFDAAALFGGLALYLAGHLFFKWRMHDALSVPRLVTVCVLLAALPGAAFLPPLAGLAGLVAILVALIAVETAGGRRRRRDLRRT